MYAILSLNLGKQGDLPSYNQIGPYRAGTFHCDSTRLSKGLGLSDSHLLKKLGFFFICWMTLIWASSINVV